MSISTKQIPDFIADLASNSPAPGGGGAAALAGAIGAALGNMVASLTVGKKKYAPVEADILKFQAEATDLQSKLLGLIDRDAEEFEPLAKAYSIPKDDPARESVMEAALGAACAVPLEIMRSSLRAIELCGEFAEKGSTLAISDAACGAIICRAAVQAAALNVFINTKSLSDREKAGELNREADELIARATNLANSVNLAVTSKLRA
ncbi:MAG: cyclodeaminase/cyclohydrolase family protein [Oscillospiraceae bacterium]|jgi:formiminotetrahydrofolate cyclodeaminase|nr:cyclodeaminase/cyclohydrolase family protein [Oscillospiraceae bacterium]